MSFFSAHSHLSCTESLVGYFFSLGRRLVRRLEFEYKINLNIKTNAYTHTQATPNEINKKMRDTNLLMPAAYARYSL